MVSVALELIPIIPIPACAEGLLMQSSISFAARLAAMLFAVVKPFTV
jgi:hypothetical protein